MDIIATAINAASSDYEDSKAYTAIPATAPDPTAANSPACLDPLAGLEHEQIVTEFERELGLDHARSPAAIRTAGRAATPPSVAPGPGGAQARADGHHEGTVTRGVVEGSRLGSALGVEGDRYGGESKPGDDGVRMAGAIAGGVIVVAGTVKGVFEILLLANAAEVTGMSVDLLARLGTRVARMSASALRESSASASCA